SLNSKQNRFVTLVSVLSVPAFPSLAVSGLPVFCPLLLVYPGAFRLACLQACHQVVLDLPASAFLPVAGEVVRPVIVVGVSVVRPADYPASAAYLAPGPAVSDHVPASFACLISR